MEASVAEVLREYERRYVHEFEDVLPTLDSDEILRERDSMLMSIGPEAGAFLSVLIRSTKPKVILELGTSYGHSTIYLAEAAKAVGATVLSCDVSHDKQAFAEHALERCNLLDCVTFLTGDACTVIRSMQNLVDFVLIDLWTAYYIPAFDAVSEHLASGALVVADNMIVPSPEAASKYRDYVRARPDFESIMLPIGWGLEVSRSLK